MVDAYIGTMLLWPMNWAPERWALCQGQELQVNQYQALYTLIGNTYGGTANKTFKLPDLRGCVPVGSEATGGQQNNLGERGGTKLNTLSLAHLPEHGHAATFDQTSVNGTCEVTVNLPNNAANVQADLDEPGPDTCLGKAKVGANKANIYTKSTPSITLNKPSVSANGTIAGQVTGQITVKPTGNPNPKPIENMPPYLVLNYIICLDGLFPPRSW